MYGRDSLKHDLRCKYKDIFCLPLHELFSKRKIHSLFDIQRDLDLDQSSIHEYAYL